jgi:hypothetical protein
MSAGSDYAMSIANAATCEYETAMLRTIGALGAALSIWVHTAPAAVALPPVVRENARAGTAAWATPSLSNAEIYASEVSATPGEPLRLHVSTEPGASYRIELYRLGWYDGAGGRLVACAPSCIGDKPGTAFPAPPPPSADPFAPAIRAEWPVTDVIQTGPRWASGYYMARVVVTAGRVLGAGGSTFVILRSPPGQRAPVLVQVPVNTWQAYNVWGGKSLYDLGSPRGYHVSFDRPYARDAQTPLTWELPIVRLLEQRGYDVSYQTDVDTDSHPGSLLGRRLVIVAGHDEYWTRRIRDAFDRGLARGVNFAFLGANIGYWQMRYADADGALAIDEYRSASADPDPDPAEKTTRFRRLAPPRPECALMGVAYNGGIGGPNDYRVTAEGAADPWFAGTGLAAGDTIRGVVGFEWDTFDPTCAAPGETVLLHSDGPPKPADSVRFTAASGSRVFSAGSLGLVAGADTFGGRVGDPRLARFLANALDDLAGGAARLTDRAPSGSAGR